jgi:hypothetical protein
MNGSTKSATGKLAEEQQNARMVDKYHNGARHLEKRSKVLLFLSLGKFGRKEMTEASTTSLINKK